MIRMPRTVPAAGWYTNVFWVFSFKFSTALFFISTIYLFALNVHLLYISPPCKYQRNKIMGTPLFLWGVGLHSLLKLFTGLANAVLIDCMITDINAVNTTIPAAMSNTQTLISIR